MSILDCRDLRVSYSGNRALHGVALTVGAGELVGIVGTQGAGKSTLVNALAGWFPRGRPSVSGAVSLRGEDVSRWAPHRRSRAGMVLVPEGKAIFDELTVEDTLDLVPRVNGDDAGRFVFSRDDVYDFFPRLHERRRHRGRALSGGERQMLAIGRGLRMAPRILLVDEPSLGLAPKVVAELLARLRKLAELGLPIVLVEQNVRAARDSVDVMHVLDHGVIVRSGPPLEIVDDSQIARSYLGEAKS